MLEAADNAGDSEDEVDGEADEGEGDNGEAREREEGSEKEGERERIEDAGKGCSVPAAACGTPREGYSEVVKTGEKSPGSGRTKGDMRPWSKAPRKGRSSSVDVFAWDKTSGGSSGWLDAGWAGCEPERK